ncbi:MAG: aminodeoxychorismate lyase [Methylobacillus sp.]|jgi:4-amino-4-deoxychorismate lyase|nr:aminodeoxychorismate lyase [Methylobacillus sp.]
MQNQFLIDGKPDAAISPADRGLAYGDGVFRTLPVRRGQPEHWSRHFRKLSDDCAALGIACPREELLLADLAVLFQDGGDGVVKIMVTRGESARGYAVLPDGEPLRIVARSPLPQYPASWHDEGVNLHLCRLRLAAQPRLAGVKHLNRLENVLARMEWDSPEIAEGLLLAENGHVIEGTMSNIFARSGSTLRTPALDQCGVAGVTRDRILELAPALKLEACSANITLDELLAADEVVLCNSLIGVWQVISLDTHRWRNAGLAEQLRQRLQP